MANLIYILFICVAIPLLLITPFVERRVRQTLIFLAIGMGVCVYASQVNGWIYGFCGDYYYLTTTLSPIVEEFLKALPIFFFAFFISDKRIDLMTAAMSVGIGFAILENGYNMLNAVDTVNFFWAFVRAFGTGLMHGICTVSIGIGMSFVHKKKKLFVCGTFALFAAAVMYHSIYNILVQSNYKYIGFFMPIVTYIPIVTSLCITGSKKKRRLNSEK